MISNDELLRGIPDDEQLSLIDHMLLHLQGERNRAEGNIYWRGRSVPEIKRDISDLEYRRKLLVDRLSVKKVFGSNKSGIFLEVGGDMVNHGTIKTDQHSTVGIAVAGNYSSNDKTKIIQGSATLDKKEWHDKPSGMIILALLIAGLIYLLGWN